MTVDDLIAEGEKRNFTALIEEYKHASIEIKLLFAGKFLLDTYNYILSVSTDLSESDINVIFDKILLSNIKIDSETVDNRVVSSIIMETSRIIYGFMLSKNTDDDFIHEAYEKHSVYLGVKCIGSFKDISNKVKEYFSIDNVEFHYDQDYLDSLTEEFKKGE